MVKDVRAVAFQAIRKLSYDTSQMNTAIEVELNPARTIPLPQDFVSLTRVSFVDGQGNIHPVHPHWLVPGEARALAQQEDFTYRYTEDGMTLEDEKTLSIERFQDRDRRLGDNGALDFTISENVNRDSTYDLTTNTSRFGLNTELATLNGFYVFNKDAGTVNLSGQFNEGDLIIVSYVTDGLKNSSDLSKVLIHKFDEFALYAIMKATLAEIFNHPDRRVLKRDEDWEIRQAKIRNSDFSVPSLERLMRGKAKWIKH